MPGKVSLKNLTKIAREFGILSDSELKDINQLMRFRNPYSHFQRPIDKTSDLQRSVRENLLLFEITEKDSIFAIRLANRMFAKLSICSF